MGCFSIHSSSKSAIIFAGLPLFLRYSSTRKISTFLRFSSHQRPNLSVAFLLKDISKHGQQDIQSIEEDVDGTASNPTRPDNNDPPKQLDPTRRIASQGAEQANATWTNMDLNRYSNESYYHYDA